MVVTEVVDMVAMVVVMEVDMVAMVVTVSRATMPL